MPLNAYERLMECDTWYGPGFDREKLDDPNATGVTVVKRNPNSLFPLDNNLDRTEFFWSSRDGIKTLQVEEISNLDYAFDQYRLNRYLHAERDTKRQVLRHVDGAVKVYIDTEYQERFNSRLPDEPRSYRKIKLWRIDGDLDVSVWLALTALFFKHNEMIIEYFDPKKFEEVFEERVRDFKAWKAKQQAQA